MLAMTDQSTAAAERSAHVTRDGGIDGRLVWHVYEVMNRTSK